MMTYMDGNLSMSEPIVVHQRADETSRTPNKACYWIASAIVDGDQFIGRSRYGALNELARQLVAAGIPDAPMFVHTAGVKGFATILSFHRAAESAYEESVTVPLRRTSYARKAAARERARSIGVEAPKQGSSDPGAGPRAADPSVPKNADHPLSADDEPMRRTPDLDRAACNHLTIRLGKIKDPGNHDKERNRPGAASRAASEPSGQSIARQSEAEPSGEQARAASSIQCSSCPSEGNERTAITATDKRQEVQSNRMRALIGVRVICSRSWAERGS
jgi:hypothetical protein